MPHSTQEAATAICQEMEVVRRELRHDADEVAHHARELADWRHYVQSYPWACVGAAALVGYILVPQKSTIVRPSSRQIAALARKQQLVVQPSGEEPRTSTWKGKVLTVASNLALRAALAYVGQQFGKKAGQEAAESSQGSSPLGSRAR